MDNPAPAEAPLASVQLGPDGSMAALVTARRALSWQLTDTNNVGVVRERYWLTFAPGEIRTCTSCHGINTRDQANHPTPTNAPIALVHLLNYWKTDALVQPAILADQGTNQFQISFVRGPAESGVTYHVQASTDLATWTDLATYNRTNIVLTAQATEISRIGTPNETITIRDNTALASRTQRFLRVSVTRP